MAVDITYDPAKDAANIASRGLSFRRAVEFEFETALIIMDTRRDYGEVRYRALGLLADHLHALVFTMRGETLHVISLRKANNREVRRYEQATRS